MGFWTLSDRRILIASSFMGEVIGLKMAVALFSERSQDRSAADSGSSSGEPRSCISCEIREPSTATGVGGGDKLSVPPNWIAIGRLVNESSCMKSPSSSSSSMNLGGEPTSESTSSEFGEGGADALSSKLSVSGDTGAGVLPLTRADGVPKGETRISNVEDSAGLRGGERTRGRGLCQLSAYPESIESSRRKVRDGIRSGNGTDGRLETSEPTGERRSGVARKEVWSMLCSAEMGDWSGDVDLDLAGGI